MDEVAHVDLFTGLGGFALAAQANGLQTIQFVEKDERCIAFLSKAWPGVPIHDDIDTFEWDSRRPVFLLTGGPPCQDASRAGKQAGAKGDRWKWPQALDVLEAVRPRWALFENPTGIRDVGLDGILSDMEGRGYEVAPPIRIPACAVNAPHLRERYWIVAHTQARQDDRRGNGDVAEAQGRGQGGDAAARGGCQGNLADAARRGLRANGRASGQTGHVDERGEGCDVEHAARHEHGEARADRQRIREPVQQGDMGDAEKQSIGTGLREKEPEGDARRWRGRPCNAGERDSFWSNYVYVPCADGKLRRAPDDSFGVVDGLHRSVLGALGNSIVWQVAAEIIAAIVEAETEFTRPTRKPQQGGATEKYNIG